MIHALLRRITPTLLRRDEHERGQVLIIVALGLVVLVAMVGVVIDGGFAWAKQRDTQNAADAAAEAGAVVLAQNVAGVSPAKTDADVDAAVNQAMSENAVDLRVAHYTDIDGQLVSPAGAVVTDEADAAVVGDGIIPSGASGVRAVGEQNFDTFLARVIGVTDFTSVAPATAVAGYLASTCPASAGCFVLPVTFPVTVLGCDGNNDPDPIDPPTFWPHPSNPLTIPLCKNGPGNVGWLDWTPTAGGTSELVDAIENPSNPALAWPAWFYITSTGNVNSASVENALNGYSGKEVMIPQFDLTCDTQPDSDPSLPNFGCPAGNVGGHGSNQWYHLAAMTAFQLCTDDSDDLLPPGGDTDFVDDCIAAGFDQGAYINGNNSATCDTGNGGTSCLAGRFVDVMWTGEVTAAPGPNPDNQLVGVQLIH